MQIGYHLTAVKAPRLERQGLLACSPRKEHGWCADGVYVWRRLELVQWWTGARSGAWPRHPRLVIVDTEGLTQEHDAAGAQWLERALEGMDHGLGAWDADRVLVDVPPERICEVVELSGKVWPDEAAWQQLHESLAGAAPSGLLASS